MRSEKFILHSHTPPIRGRKLEHTPEIKAAITAFGMDALEEHFATLRTRVQTGEMSLPFAIGGLESILDGELIARKFPAWMSVRPPPHDPHYARTFDNFWAALNATGHLFAFGGGFTSREFWDHRLEQADHPTLLDEFDLVRVRPADLGFKGYRSVKLNKLHARAKELGLMLCPPKVAFYLRLAYLDQPAGEWLHIATPVIFDHNLHMITLRMGRGHDKTLHLDTIKTRDCVQSDEEIVYMTSGR